MSGSVRPIAGYRIWRLYEGRLHGPWLPMTWLSAKEHATCFVRGSFVHSVPSKHCVCGIHAFHDVDSATNDIPRDCVVGAVIGTGGVLVHWRGFRAKCVEIVAIADYPPVPTEQLSKVAREYGVPLCSIEDLTARARARGRFIGKNLARRLRLEAD